MDISPEILSLSTELAKVVGRKSVESIIDKIRTVKEKGNKDEIINNLEEIINDLISDKNRLVHISQAYEEQLITQKITENEIEYITTSIIPLIENLLMQSEGENVEKIHSGLNVIKPILSKETFSIMQMLGFNFKQAIGEPLTQLLAALIKSKIPDSTNHAHQILAQQREIEYLKVCQDEEAYKRLMSMYNK